MEGCIEEQPHQPEMAHSLETAIRGHDMSGNDGEAAAAHFLTEKIVFRVECLFVKPTEFVETRPVEKHEHSRAEWLVQPCKAVPQHAATIEWLMPTRCILALNT